jgi:hypothetical protein
MSAWVFIAEVGYALACDGPLQVLRNRMLEPEPLPDPEPELDAEL